MVFSELNFIFIFLPLFLFFYFIVPYNFRNLILFLSSLLFYAWGEPYYVFIMIFSTVFDYTIGILIDKFDNNELYRKILVTASIIVNIGLLGFFKYSNFFIANTNAIFNSNINPLNILLPIGISFYTFQTMSYTIDLYRRKIKVQKNIISFGAYVSMFPQLIAGPIIKYSDINSELETRTITAEKFSYGIERFVIGLGKKVLLANNIGMLWDIISKMNYSDMSYGLAWLGIISFALHLYYDFSGYSDMAIGLGAMLGFTFTENFNKPYKAQSITEFWRRWHITLGSWFREYVYIPLGGNRVTKFRAFLNIMVVWFLTGFWHGAEWSFILWGLYFGIIMIIEKKYLLKVLKKTSCIISRLYVIFIVLISWVMFAIPDLTSITEYFKALFFLNGSGFYSGEFMYLLSNYIVIILLAILLDNIDQSKIKSKLPQWVKISLLFIILILSTAYLVDATYNPFLYFRF